MGSTSKMEGAVVVLEVAETRIRFKSRKMHSVRQNTHFMLRDRSCSS